MRARDIPEAVEAADPSTSPERLGDIADVYQELHPILVLNPACPDDLRQWIRATTPEANEAWENHLAAERAQREAASSQTGRQSWQIQQSQYRSASSNKKGWERVGRWLVLGVVIISVIAVIRGCGRLVQQVLSSSGSDTSTSATPSVSPAPANAISASSASRFQSPTQNISCEIYDDRASCSIYARDYGDAGLEDCDGTYFSMEIRDSASPACGSEFATDGMAMTLEYGESVKSEGFACSSADDGMRCWNQSNGHGFKIAREGYSTF